MKNITSIFPLICLLLLLCAQATGAQDVTEENPATEDTSKEVFDLQQRWSLEDADKIIFALQDGKPIPYFVQTEESDSSILRYDLRGINFNKASLRGVDLSHADMKWASLVESDLEESNLSYTNLTGADLSLANLWKADLTEAALTNAMLDGALLDEADLRSSDLSGAVFTEASLKGANLAYADMKNAWLTGGDFTDADLSYANLEGAYLFGAVLDGAKLVGTDIKGAVIEPGQMWEIDFTGARNMSQIVWGNEEAASPFIINAELDGRLQDALIRYRDLKSLYKKHLHEEVIKEFHYRENVVKTNLSPQPVRTLRRVFLEWTYGYGSKPLRLIPFYAGVILVFGIVFSIQTLLPGRSGIYLLSKGEKPGRTFYVRESGSVGQGEKQYIMEEADRGDSKPALLRFERGAVIVNCIYFSLLSFATFGYGALRPRQWLEFFRLTPVEYRPAGWARIFVGFEAAVGIYLLALTAIVLFKG